MGFKAVRNVGLSAPLFIGVLAVSSFAVARNSDDAFDEAFQSMKRDDKLQFDLPPPPEPPKLDWLEKVIQFIAKIMPVLEVLFYLAVGAIVLFILYSIAKVIYETRFEQKEKKVEEVVPPPLYTPDQEQARILLEEVDALAAEGKYKEAVHELLFRSIQDIDIRRPNTIRRSLTSREIASLEILTPTTRQAFATIGNVVETSYFGGQEIGQKEFDVCRAAYAQFAEKSAWKKAA